MSLVIPSSDRQTYEVPDQDGVELYYRHPSNPEVHALINKYSTNGVRDPEIFTPATQNGEKVVVFAFEAARLFIVGWGGVNHIENDKEVPVRFILDRIGLLPDAVLADFAADIIFKYIGNVLLRGSGMAEAESEEEEEPIPN